MPFPSLLLLIDFAVATLIMGLNFLFLFVPGDFLSDTKHFLGADIFVPFKYS